MQGIHVQTLSPPALPGKTSCAYLVTHLVGMSIWGTYRRGVVNIFSTDTAFAALKSNGRDLASALCGGGGGGGFFLSFALPLPFGAASFCDFARGPYISRFGGFKHHLFGP